jgi:hypothetical protein
MIRLWPCPKCLEYVLVRPLCSNHQMLTYWGQQHRMDYLFVLYGLWPHVSDHNIAPSLKSVLPTALRPLLRTRGISLPVLFSTHFAIYLWSTYHRLILLTTYLYKSCSLVWLMIYLWCTYDLLMTYFWFTYILLIFYLWSTYTTYGLLRQIMFTYITYDLLMIYLWCTYGQVKHAFTKVTYDLLIIY